MCLTYLLLGVYNVISIDNKGMARHMDIKKGKAIIEAILFAAGREVKVLELMAALEISKDEVMAIINELKNNINK